MKKFLFPLVIVLILALAVPSFADAQQTFQNFWSAVFEDGDLKLAFEMLSSDDQEFIKTETPEVYSFLIGENRGDLGEVGAIVTALQDLIFSTMGKLLKLDSSVGVKNGQGTEVLYSVSIPIGTDFITEIVTWAKAKQAQFMGAEPEDPVKAIADAINELGVILDKADYKESISFNSFVTVVSENGKEKLSFNFRDDFAKLQKLGMDMESL